VHAGRAYAVTTDLVANEIHRYGSSHRQHRTRAHRICKSIDQADQRGNRSQIENRAAAGLFHPRRRRLRAKKQSLDVDRVDAIEIALAGVFNGSDMRDAGIVDEDAETGASQSIPPKAASTDSAEATSQAIAVAIHRSHECSPRFPPRLVSRSSTNTRALAVVKVLAIARPIPEPAPITAAIFPSSRDIATSEL
jgi:hypothetical protein